MQGNQWLQFVGLLIIVGFSVISWLYRKLNEQAAKKKARDMIEARQRELLRTGRDPVEIRASVPQPETAEMQRQREIAARREQQLAELRRRAQMRQQRVEVPSAPPSAQQGGNVPPILMIPGSAGPTVPQRRGPMQRPAARPAQVARPQSKRAPQARPQLKPPQRGQQRPSRARIVVVEEEETTHRLVPEEAAPVSRPSPVVMAAAPQTAEEWRRAIIANEILSPPLAMRTQEVSVPF